MKLIGTAGPDITSEKYSSAWDFYHTELESNPDFVYAVDEHYYMSPEWFQSNAHFYDEYSRKIKVFAGEYAAHFSNGMNRPELNNWGAALSEAAFMIGLERNGDLVEYASYAPLLARKNYAQWSPDLIWFDGESSYGTPSYYVQALFSRYRGACTLSTEIEQEELLHSVTLSEDHQIIYIKMVNTKPTKVSVSMDLELPVEAQGELILLKGAQMDGNSFEWPDRIAPEKYEFKFMNHGMLEIEPEALYILLLKKQG